MKLHEHLAKFDENLAKMDEKLKITGIVALCWSCGGNFYDKIDIFCRYYSLNWKRIKLFVRSLIIITGFEVL